MGHSVMQGHGEYEPDSHSDSYFLQPCEVATPPRVGGLTTPASAQQALGSPLACVMFRRLLLRSRALDSHPFFPLRAALGRCILTAAAACVPCGAVPACEKGLRTLPEVLKPMLPYPFG